MPNEILELKGAYSLIRPNRPDNLPLQGIDRIMKEAKEESLEKLGLFDNGSPNYYTYYPDVKPEDLNPSDAEFIYPVFRLLSKVLIAPKRMAVDFTNGDVLKKSMSLLIGQTIFIDHEAVTGSAMGSIQSVEWQEEYKLGAMTIPAGINGVLKLDAKANPRIARLIMMDPPGIHSCSVTINFSWQKSHPDLDDNAFYNQLGSFDKKGIRVRKVVDDIKMYFELSLVPHGADPFAKKLTDGKLVMAKQANKIYQMSLSASQMEKIPYLGISTDGGLIPFQSMTLNFSDKSLFNTNDSNINNQEEMDFQELLISLGLDPTVITDEQALVAHFNTQAESVASLTSEVTRLGEEVTALTSERDTLTESVATLTATQADAATLALAETGRLALSTIVAEAEKFYRLAKGDKVDDAILASIQSANFATAEAFATTFRQEYEESVPLACNDCHSLSISRRASGASSTKPVTTGDLKLKIQEAARKESNDNFLNK